MITLVLPESIVNAILDLLRLEVETGAVLLARLVRTSQGLRLLGTELVLVPDDAYERREHNELRVASAGFVPPLRRAEETATIPIWLHTHPGEGSSPSPSRRDLLVDQQLAPLFRLRAESEFYGSFITAPTGEGFQFDGHLESESMRLVIDRVWTVGARLSLTWNKNVMLRVASPIFDRNVRAFGGDVQRVLQDLTVGIVGCGGTGSSVAEQLVRLGVRRFILIDPDELSETNLTRVYGSRAADIGRPKVDVLSDHLRRIAPEAEVHCLASKVTVERTARSLMDTDLVFGCTDDNAGRLVLSRLATYLLTPVIDCGVILTSDNAGRMDGINGRVTILCPGAACLVCRDRVDLARAASEALTPEEHLRRADEGYAPGLPGVEPAVVAFTTLVGAQAVGELLERLTGYGPNPVPSEVLLRMHEREISTNLVPPRQGHYCHPGSGKMGLGITDPFLEQTWPA